MTKKKSSKSSAKNTIRNIRRNSRKQYPKADVDVFTWVSVK